MSATSGTLPSSEPTFTPTKTMDAFLKEAEELFLEPVSLQGRLKFATDLKAQLKSRLDHVNTCMLPSYHYLLPTGREQGRIVAIDLGGTTLRIALVELGGRRQRLGGGDKGGEAAEEVEEAEEVGVEDIRILKRATWKIEQDVKALVGMTFFVWLADRIAEAVEDRLDTLHEDGKNIPLALSWSFPVNQTSVTTGLIQPMGKGFHASDGMLNRDLATVVRTACHARGLSVSLRAVMNDSDATLFSQAYSLPGTRMGLILGTGANVSCYLPVAGMAREKFGDRDGRWFDAASHVVVNVELGCCGQAVMPFTRWDDELRAAHPRPDFQPFEYFTSGQYLGEICRLAVVDAIRTTGALGGVVPLSLEGGYSLDTEVLSAFEADSTPTLETARATFVQLHPSNPTPDDLALIKKLAHLVATRSTALVSAALFSLWDLRRDCAASLSTDPSTPTIFATVARAELDLAQTVVSYNGAVIEKYPGYRDGCQRLLDEMVRWRVNDTGDESAVGVELVAATESSLLGAAVAAACMAEEHKDIAGADSPVGGRLPAGATAA